jgi:hypothetical protein
MLRVGRRTDIRILVHLAGAVGIVLVMLAEWLAAGGLLLEAQVEDPRHVRGELWQASVKLPRACRLAILVICPHDDSSEPRASTLSMFDSHGELGPPHSPHVEIERSGEGRFSHWGGVLNYSARIKGAADAGTLRVLVAPAATPAFWWLALMCVTVWLVAWAAGRWAEAGWRGVGNFAVQVAGSCASALVLSAIVLAAFPPQLTVRLESPRRANGEMWAAGLQYPRVPLGWALHFPSDSAGAPTASTLRLFNSQGELGPAHSLHADIASLGGGRFSDWNHVLLFSLGDSQGSAAEISSVSAIASPQIRPWLLLLSLLLAAPVMVRVAKWSARSPATQRIAVPVAAAIEKRAFAWPIVAAIGVAHFSMLFVGMGSSVLLASDSDSYLVFSPLTTPGYSLLVHVLLAIFETPLAIVAFQFWAALISIVYLCRQLEQDLSWMVALPVGILIIAKDGLNSLHVAILSDSITVSLSLLVVAVFMRQLKRPTARSAVPLFLLLFAALAVRPATAYLLVLGVLVAIIVYRRAKAPAVAMIAAVVTAAIAQPLLVQATQTMLASAATDRYVMSIWSGQNGPTPYWGGKMRASGTQSGYMLFLQVRLGLQANQRSAYPEDTRELAQALAGEREQFFNARSWRAKYATFESGYSALTTKTTVARLHPQEIASVDGWIFQEELLGRLAVETIRNAPEHMLLITCLKLGTALTERMLGNWAIGREEPYVASPAASHWARRYGVTATGMVASPAKSLSAQVERFRPLLVWSTSAVAVLGVVLLPLVILGRVRRPELVVLAVLSAAFLGYTLMVCLVQAPIWRYGEAISAIGLACLFGWLWFMGTALTRSSKHRASWGLAPNSSRTPRAPIRG